MILCLHRLWQSAQNKYSNRLFLHKHSDSEMLTYAKYAADSLPYLPCNSMRLILRICQMKRKKANRMDALSAIGIETQTP